MAGSYSGPPDNLIDALTRRLQELKGFDLNEVFGVIRSQGRSLERTEERFWKMGHRLRVLGYGAENSVTATMEQLDQLIEAIGALNNRLLLVIGVGKTRSLQEVAHRLGAPVIDLGSSLGRRLMPLSHRQRTLQAGGLLSQLVQERAAEDLAIVDNLEILFDASLALNPLTLLRQQSRVRRLVAAWPGELHNGHLTYAKIGHPEHRDYPLDGLVTFELDA